MSGGIQIINRRYREKRVTLHGMETDKKFADLLEDRNRLLKALINVQHYNASAKGENKLPAQLMSQIEDALNHDEARKTA
ncbi:MAG: hypothetical protein JWO19_4433 [Bryobacterales bacterium]|nr:hypothetical protein [Bryobacterales bacterium]